MKNDHVLERTDRYERFYRSNQPGDLLVVVRQNPYWMSKKNLFDYDFENGGHLAMAEDMALCAETLMEKSIQVGDDMVPWICPDFGIAINHTYVIDMPIKFAEWTSWASAPLMGPDGWARLPEVRYDPENRWVRLIKEMVEVLQARPSQPYLVNGHYHFSPLDLANALRGNDVFTDFYENPDEVTELLRRCTETIGAFEADLRGLLGDRPGVPFWGAVAPRNSIFVSEDAMDMCGPRISAEWGQRWTEQLRDRFGSLTIHHHMMGHKTHGLIGQMARNSLVQISNDPNYPPAAEQLLDLYAASGTNALMFDCGLEELRRLKDVLARIRAVVVVAVGDDQDAAREAVALVRSISTIPASVESREQECTPVEVSGGI